MSARDESIYEWMTRLVEARQCCGTCAGGVIADRDRRLLAAERDRIAQAIEADGPGGYFHGETAEGYRIALDFAARIARSAS